MGHSLSKYIAEGEEDNESIDPNTFKFNIKTIQNCTITILYDSLNVVEATKLLNSIKKLPTTTDYTIILKDLTTNVKAINNYSILTTTYEVPSAQKDVIPDDNNINKDDIDVLFEKKNGSITIISNLNPVFNINENIKVLELKFKFNTSEQHPNIIYTIANEPSLNIYNNGNILPDFSKFQPLPLENITSMGKMVLFEQLPPGDAFVTKMKKKIIRDLSNDDKYILYRETNNINSILNMLYTIVARKQLCLIIKITDQTPFLMKSALLFGLYYSNLHNRNVAIVNNSLFCFGYDKLDGNTLSYNNTKIQLIDGKHDFKMPYQFFLDHENKYIKPISMKYGHVLTFSNVDNDSTTIIYKQSATLIPNESMLYDFYVGTLDVKIQPELLGALLNQKPTDFQKAYCYLLIEPIPEEDVITRDFIKNSPNLFYYELIHKNEKYTFLTNIEMQKDGTCKNIFQNFPSINSIASFALFSELGPTTYDYCLNIGSFQGDRNNLTKKYPYKNVPNIAIIETLHQKPIKSDITLLLNIEKTPIAGFYIKAPFIHAPDDFTTPNTFVFISNTVTSELINTFLRQVILKYKKYNWIYIFKQIKFNTFKGIISETVGTKNIYNVVYPIEMKDVKVTNNCIEFIQKNIKKFIYLDEIPKHTETNELVCLSATKPTSDKWDFDSLSQIYYTIPKTFSVNIFKQVFSGGPVKPLIIQYDEDVIETPKFDKYGLTAASVSYISTFIIMPSLETNKIKPFISFLNEFFNINKNSFIVVIFTSKNNNQETVVNSFFSKDIYERKVTNNSFEYKNIKEKYPIISFDNEKAIKYNKDEDDLGFYKEEPLIQKFYIQDITNMKNKKIITVNIPFTFNIRLLRRVSLPSNREDNFTIELRKLEEAPIRDTKWSGGLYNSFGNLFIRLTFFKGTFDEIARFLYIAKDLLPPTNYNGCQSFILISLEEFSRGFRFAGFEERITSYLNRECIFLKDIELYIISTIKFTYQDFQFNIGPFFDFCVIPSNENFQSVYNKPNKSLNVLNVANSEWTYKTPLFTNILFDFSYSDKHFYAQQLDINLNDGLIKCDPVDEHITFVTSFCVLDNVHPSEALNLVKMIDGHKQIMERFVFILYLTKDFQTNSTNCWSRDQLFIIANNKFLRVIEHQLDTPVSEVYKIYIDDVVGTYMKFIYWGNNKHVYNNKKMNYLQDVDFIINKANMGTRYSGDIYIDLNDRTDILPNYFKFSNVNADLYPQFYNFTSSSSSTNNYILFVRPVEKENFIPLNNYRNYKNLILTFKLESVNNNEINYTEVLNVLSQIEILYPYIECFLLATNNKMKIHSKFVTKINNINYNTNKFINIGGNFIYPNSAVFETNTNLFKLYDNCYYYYGDDVGQITFIEPKSIIIYGYNNFNISSTHDNLIVKGVKLKPFYHAQINFIPILFYSL
ncbi:ATPase/DNA helicase-like protein [Glossina pallidipes salivary gland hypertrophy virus]|uniref:ATPase/DNA helicase-like protein n=1 Tax=Glossina hytrovirus (isolate Glossina pallidipes/Ethiopia/Seibersdorf/-) TaxID=379529 RepID=A0A0Y0KFU1_GHVS|nr:ATPase/DNA helicase-like protein [Glossina pallidipes salivary gland hypertrophy virus]